MNTFSEEANERDYFSREDITWPDEELVMKVAAHWSIDPSGLEERDADAPALGLLGKMITY